MGYIYKRCLINNKF